MAHTPTGNKTHDAAMQTAEATRQLAQVPGASQATLKAADVQYFRSARASAIANGIQPGFAIAALQELGTGGI
jgi:hypothetical protein